LNRAWQQTLLNAAKAGNKIAFPAFIPNDFSLISTLCFSLPLRLLKKRN
jgi:hypothetical protein